MAHLAAAVIHLPKPRLLFQNRSGFIINRCHRSSSSCRSGNKTIKCQSAGNNSVEPTVYQGVYGPWSVESSDIQEVILYRSGLVISAACFIAASSTSFFPISVVERNVDLLYGVGASGLGLSLYLIHIYVTEIKRALQALWALGAVGSLATDVILAQPQGKSLVQYVVENPMAVWFVGPLFAALTGLVFKEGILTFIIPALLLGHLTGLMDDGAKVALLGVWMALFLVFAARKFTQPIKDDIGDKSVFIFNALPEEEKRTLIEKLERQN